MFEFYWNPLSINFLIELMMLMLVGALFLVRLIKDLRLKQGIRASFWMFMLFASSSVGVFLQLLSEILPPASGNLILPSVGLLGLVAILSYNAFAYFYRYENRPVGWGGYLLFSFFGAYFLLEVYITAQRYLLLEQGVVEYRQYWVELPMATAFLLSFLFFFAHLVRVKRQEGAATRLAAYRGALTTLLLPLRRESREASALRAFFYASLAPVLYAFIFLARTYGLINWTIAQTLGVWGILLVLSSFVLVYLNYVPEQSSFRIKLVGATLLSVLSILTGISWLIGAVYVENYQSKHYMTDRSAVRFEPTEQGGYRISRTRYYFDQDLGAQVTDRAMPVRLTFPFKFYDRQYDHAYISQNGVVGFERPPRWQDFGANFGPQAAIFVQAIRLQQPRETSHNADETSSSASGLYINQGARSGRITITWNDLHSSTQPEKLYSFQLRLYPTGVIEMAYDKIPSDPNPQIFDVAAAPAIMGIVPDFANRTTIPLRFASNLPVTLGKGQGAIEHYRLAFGHYLNRIYEPIAYFIVGSVFLILLIFPYLFRINLELPLRKLLNGVRRIMDGKLDTSIQVVYRDEIGYLAKSFNEMASAQNELVQTLEEKVARRTAEATNYAAKNARLEERNHLSRELHDAVSQTLFSSNLIADTLKDPVSMDPQKLEHAVKEIQRLNREALGEMRNLLLELRPEKLSAYPFGDLLKNSVQQTRKNFNVEIDVQIDGDVSLPSKVQLAFYRIAQECLNNAAKHAKADTIEVFFDGIQNQALLSVKDNGSGFDQMQIAPGSLGIQIMQERITEIGGTLEIETSPGKGTSITAIWFDDERH